MERHDVWKRSSSRHQKQSCSATKQWETLDRMKRRWCNKRNRQETFLLVHQRIVSFCLRIVTWLYSRARVMRFSRGISWERALANETDGQWFTLSGGRRIAPVLSHAGGFFVHTNRFLCHIALDIRIQLSQSWKKLGALLLLETGQKFFASNFISTRMMGHQH